jgi:Zn-dependent membrane protease YugP
MLLFLILTIPPLVFGYYASQKTKRTFEQYSRVRPANGMNGAEAAAAVMRTAGLPDLSIESVEGTLSDHYDPRTKTLRLSREVGQASSIAALGVAAHEAGHAVQDARGYGPMRLRQSLVPAMAVGQRLWIFPVFIGGILMSAGNALGTPLFLVGIAFFAVIVVFQLVTLPVEFDASNRALSALEAQGLLSASEVPGAKAVLDAAALTYVAGFLASLGQLLYFVLQFMGSNRN